MFLCQRLFWVILIGLGLTLSPFSFNEFPLSYEFDEAISAKEAITSVLITICGNGIVEEGELCDDGSNNGAYSTTISGRYCNTTCDGWGPYCGDGILQQEYNEECDDGNNNSNDGCSAACKIEEGGGGAGGGPFPGGSYVPPQETGVIIKGKAYPFAEVYLLKDGEVTGLTKANSLADFTFILTDVTPGVTTFGFWAQDSEGLKSIFLTITFQVVPNAITTVSGVFLPPTIKSDKISVRKGDVITIAGQTIPETQVYVYISSDEEIIKETKSDRLGVWQLPFDTSPLQENTFHTAKALFQTRSLGVLVKSGFSKFISFYVGEGVPEELLCPGADLNKDGRVNLLDFSILLFYWGTSDPCADQNQDGIVNLADFSIMMYYWTG